MCVAIFCDARSNLAHPRIILYHATRNNRLRKDASIFSSGQLFHIMVKHNQKDSFLSPCLGQKGFAERNFGSHDLRRCECTCFSFKLVNTLSRAMWCLISGHSSQSRENTHYSASIENMKFTAIITTVAILSETASAFALHPMAQRAKTSLAETKVCLDIPFACSRLNDAAYLPTVSSLAWLLACFSGMQKTPRTRWTRQAIRLPKKLRRFRNT